MSVVVNGIAVQSPIGDLNALGIDPNTATFFKVSESRILISDVYGTYYCSVDASTRYIAIINQTSSVKELNLNLAQIFDRTFLSGEYDILCTSDDKIYYLNVSDSSAPYIKDQFDLGVYGSGEIKALESIPHDTFGSMYMYILAIEVNNVFLIWHNTNWGFILKDTKYFKNIAYSRGVKITKHGSNEFLIQASRVNNDTISRKVHIDFTLEEIVYDSATNINLDVGTLNSYNYMFKIGDRVFGLFSNQDTSEYNITSLYEISLLESSPYAEADKIEDIGGSTSSGLDDTIAISNEMDKFTYYNHPYYLDDDGKTLIIIGKSIQSDDIAAILIEEDSTGNIITTNISNIYPDGASETLSNYGGEASLVNFYDDDTVMFMYDGDQRTLEIDWAIIPDPPIVYSVTSTPNYDGIPTWGWNRESGVLYFRISFDNGVTDWIETSDTSYTSPTILDTGNYTLYVQASVNGTDYSSSGYYTIEVNREINYSEELELSDESECVVVKPTIRSDNRVDKVFGKTFVNCWIESLSKSEGSSTNGLTISIDCGKIYREKKESEEV